MARAHDGDAVAHGERLLLVVRDEDEGDAALALDALELELHLTAELEVERAERLIEQEDVGAVDERAGDGDALLLAAGEAGDTALFEPGEADELEHAADLLCGLLLVLAAQIGAEGDVLRDVQVREERIALEDGIDGALVGRQGDDILPLVENFAAGRRFKAADAAQQRGFAAAGGAEQRHELVLADVNAHAAEGGEAVLEDDADIADGKNGILHGAFLLRNE